MIWSFCLRGKNKILSGTQCRDPPAFLSLIFYLLSFLEVPTTPIVKYKKLDSRAVVPTYATPGAAAADLCAVLDEPLTLAPMQRTLVPTGRAIELPGPECVALV